MPGMLLAWQAVTATMWARRSCVPSLVWTETLACTDRLPAAVHVFDTAPSPATSLPAPYPAACSQAEAEAYCRLHSGRLLTEPEYEHAAASEAAASGALRQLEEGGWEWTGSMLIPLPGESRGPALRVAQLAAVPAHCLYPTPAPPAVLPLLCCTGLQWQCVWVCRV